MLLGKIFRQRYGAPLGLALFAIPLAAGRFPAAWAQAAPAAAPHASGTLKAVTPQALVLTDAAGQDYAVTLTPSTKILLVPPGSHTLSAAQPGTSADLSGGDRAIVNGTAGDSGQALTATRVIVMKSSAIAANHAAEEAEWAHGAGGIVRAVDPATGVITLASGMRTLKVHTTPATVVRRYAGGSVRFEDTVLSNVAAVHPGDQMRVRGPRQPGGDAITADEIVAGTFSNFSGVLSAVDPAARTVTLKDLATRRNVTVEIGPQSDLRALPPAAAQALAGREHGAAGAEHGGGASDRARTGAAGQATEQAAGDATGRQRGMDLSRMLSRLPTETLAELKPGEAVMIVASGGLGDAGGSGTPVAVTLLSGVGSILAAHPAGETALSPWSLGAEGMGEGGEGGGQ